MRINTKFIQACKCEEKINHSYCISALVVRSQRIYCKDCGAYYFLYVKSEKLCSQELFTVMAKYVGIFLLLLAFAVCTLLLDSYLKQKHQNIVNNTNNSFSITSNSNWIVMVPLTIILMSIMAWCFYFRFIKAVQSRRRLIWFEVLDQKNNEFNISRYQAKENMHLINEVTNKLKSLNYLFDKYWYK